MCTCYVTDCVKTFSETIQAKDYTAYTYCTKIGGKEGKVDLWVFNTWWFLSIFLWTPGATVSAKMTGTSLPDTMEVLPCYFNANMVLHQQVIQNETKPQFIAEHKLSFSLCLLKVTTKWHVYIWFHGWSNWDPWTVWDVQGIHVLM